MGEGEVDRLMQFGECGVNMPAEDLLRELFGEMT